MHKWWYWDLNSSSWTLSSFLTVSGHKSSEWWLSVLRRRHYLVCGWPKDVQLSRLWKPFYWLMKGPGLQRRRLSYQISSPLTSETIDSLLGRECPPCCRTHEDTPDLLLVPFPQSRNQCLGIGAKLLSALGNLSFPLSWGLSTHSYCPLYNEIEAKHLSSGMELCRNFAHPSFIAEMRAREAWVRPGWRGLDSDCLPSLHSLFIFVH